MDGEYYDNYGSNRPSGIMTWEILPIWLYITAAISAYDAFKAFTPSLSKRVLFARYPSCPWQECSSLAARQFGVVNVLLTLVRIQAGLSIHSYGAFNVAICSAAVLLVHYVSERMMGSLRGGAMSAAEVATFITFVWMMVQKGQYVEPSSPGVGGEVGLMHPMKGGPYAPDQGYVGAM